jgi:hypothetical protein
MNIVIVVICYRLLSFIIILYKLGPGYPILSYLVVRLGWDRTWDQAFLMGWDVGSAFMGWDGTIPVARSAYESESLAIFSRSSLLRAERSEL